jgi:hypothetical protein
MKYLPLYSWLPNSTVTFDEKILWSVEIIVITGYYIAIIIINWLIVHSNWIELNEKVKFFWTQSSTDDKNYGIKKKTTKKTPGSYCLKNWLYTTTIIIWIC